MAAEVEKSTEIAGIAGKRNFSMITLEKSLMNKEVGFAYRLLGTLERFGVSCHKRASYSAEREREVDGALGRTVGATSAKVIAVSASRTASLTTSQRPRTGHEHDASQAAPEPSTHAVIAIGPSIATITSATAIDAKGRMSL